jgi:UDPglucose 6-dehydrogenase
MRLSVIGLGKLGAPMAAVYAARGHEVVGVDKNQDFVNALREGRPPVEEPQLQEMIDAGRERIDATTEYADAIARSDVTMIIVPTPSGPDGVFINDYVIAAVEAIGAELRKKDSYHLVVVTSTVMPGSTGGPIREALEAASGRTVGVDVGLCYNPEFIALGSVVNDLLYPDFLLIGESDPKAGDLLVQMYDVVCPDKPVVRRMNHINAELTKIAVNTYVTTKISYANMIADVCDRLPGADANIVTEAVGSDSRIGRKYLKGAVAYGGPCFPRDNVAFSVLADRIGARADLARSTDAINRYQTDRVTAALYPRIAAGARIAVLGLSYKPHSGVIEESPGVALCRRLLDDGYEVVMHDPQALSAARKALGKGAEAAPTAEDAIEDVDAVVLMTPWPSYGNLRPEQFRRGDGRRAVVLDCWRLWSREALEAVADVVWIGYGVAPVSEAVTAS